MFRNIMLSLTLLCALLLLLAGGPSRAQTAGSVYAGGAFLYGGVYGGVTLNVTTPNGSPKGEVSLFLPKSRVNALVYRVDWISPASVRIFAIPGGYPGILEVDLTVMGGIRTIAFRETNRATGAIVFDSGSNLDGTPFALPLVGDTTVIQPPVVPATSN